VNQISLEKSGNNKVKNNANQSVVKDETIHKDYSNKENNDTSDITDSVLGVIK
jgi:hypothetical protein